MRPNDTFVFNTYQRNTTDQLSNAFESNSSFTFFLIFNWIFFLVKS